MPLSKKLATRSPIQATTVITKDVEGLVNRMNAVMAKFHDDRYMKAEEAWKAERKQDAHTCTKLTKNEDGFCTDAVHDIKDGYDVMKAKYEGGVLLAAALSDVMEEFGIPRLSAEDPNSLVNRMVKRIQDSDKVMYDN